MKQILIILILTFNLIIPVKSNAACVCACVNGKVKAICSKKDLKVWVFLTKHLFLGSGL